MPFSILAIVLGGLAAALVGFSKTGVPGAGIPAVALMAEAFRENTRLSVGAILPILLLGDVFAIAYWRRHAQWRRILELAPYVAVGMVPGYLVLWKADGDTLRTLIGCLILALLLLHLARRQLGLNRLPDRWWITAFAGVLAGFGTAMGNAAGPIMSIYLLSKGLDKEEFLGTAAWFFFLVNFSKLPFFPLVGALTTDTLRFDLYLIPGLVLGAVTGAAIAKRMPQYVFDALVLLLAGIAALHLIFH